jgi:hypothetical protein
MIRPDFWTDEALGALSPVVRLLFMGLISHADDEGRLRGAPALIRSEVFPYDVGISVEDVLQWLGHLEASRLIIRYVAGGQSFIHVRNFTKHQTINRPTESKLPEPPEEDADNAPYELVGNRIPIVDGGLSESSVSSVGVMDEDSLPIEKKRIEEKGRVHEDESSYTRAIVETIPPVETTESKPPPKRKAPTAPAQAPPRPRNALYDAIAAACFPGVAIGDIPRPAQSGLGRAAAELSKLSTEVTPQAVAYVAKRYREHSTLKDCLLTPDALTKHWPTLIAGYRGTNHATNRGLTPADDEALRALATTGRGAASGR